MASRSSYLTGATGFILLLLVLRVIFLLGALDPSQEQVMEVLGARHSWPNGPERPLYDREELYAGTAAEAIRTGLDLPLSAYRFMHYGSGSLIISLLAVPIYALLGPHYLAFKLLPLLVTLLGGLFWFLTVREWLGRRVAWFFGLLYIFAPSVLVRTALIAKGDHPEAMMIVGLVLFLATRAAHTGSDRARALMAAACGLVAGLGIYATYSTIPVLVAVGLVASIWTRLRPPRAWAGFGVGFAVGLLPWLLTSIVTSGRTLQVYGESLGTANALSEILTRLQLLGNRGLLAAYDLPGGAVARSLGGLLWLLAVLSGWVLIIRIWRWRAPAVLMAAATAAHLGAFCLLAPDASSRYLIPGYPLFLIAVACLARTSDRASSPGHEVSAPPAAATPHAGRGRLAVILVVLLLGLLSQISSVADCRFPALRAPLSGTDWQLLGEIAGQKVLPGVIAELPGHLRPHFWVGFGKGVFGQIRQADWEKAGMLAGPGEAHKVWEGIGIAWIERGWKIEQAGRLMSSLPPEARAGLRRGLARHGEVLFVPMVAAGGAVAIECFLDGFPDEDRPELRVALGRTLGVLATQGADMVRLSPAREEVGAGRGRVPGAEAGRGRARPKVEVLVGSAELLRGAGWALYRSVGARQGYPRFWVPPDDSWTASAAARLRSGGDSAELWQGVAEAYERDLSTLYPRWLQSDRGAAVQVAEELSALTRGLPAPSAAAFYRAAGRAVGRARRDPSCEWGGGGAFTLPSSAGAGAVPRTWEQSIPEPFQAAFRAGFSEGLASF